jgi:hypothetical protein
MDHPDREAEPQFTQPVRQIISMVIVLALVGVGAYIAYPQVAPVFLANPWLNGFIGFVFVIGVFACFWQLYQLVSGVSWIEGFAADRPGHNLVRAPRLLAPLAALLRSRGKRMQISASSSRSILDSVATRIDEARDITRYITNLLIFLGLLGTFYGLATTVPAVVDTIRSLAPQEGEDGIVIFERLMSGLEAQLGGMGVAFASSLLGLAGSLVVGLLELFAGHGQNRFYRELEEWLSTITRLGFAGADSGEPGESSEALGVLEHLAEHLVALRELQETTEAGRGLMDDRIVRLTESVERLARNVEAESGGSAAFARIADGQEKIAKLLQAREKDAAPSGGGAAVDAESRMRLRSMDVQLLRILEEMSAGRQESIAEIRSDLAQLTKAIRQLGRDAPVVPPRRGS